jgi:hypothetical protein
MNNLAQRRQAASKCAVHTTPRFPLIVLECDWGPHAGRVINLHTEPRRVDYGPQASHKVGRENPS